MGKKSNQVHEMSVYNLPCRLFEACVSRLNPKLVRCISWPGHKVSFEQGEKVKEQEAIQKTKKWEFS